MKRNFWDFSRKMSDKIKRVCHKVFEGCEIIYTEINGASSLVRSEENAMYINYCREGRTEYNVNGRFVTLTPGDMAISFGSVGTDWFPLKKYSGLTVKIDAEKTPENFVQILEDVNVSPKKLFEKFLKSGGYAAKSGTNTEHIFSELYSVPESIKKGYFKVKILELMLILSTIEPESDEEKFVSARQIELAKNIKEYLQENISRRVTAEELAKEFNVSLTGIKQTFRIVYGVPLYCFQRSEKMREAARLLKETDKSVIDIAGSVGYDNASKFACAFRQCMGVSPAKYRTH